MYKSTRVKLRKILEWVDYKCWETRPRPVFMWEEMTLSSKWPSSFPPAQVKTTIWHMWTAITDLFSVRLSGAWPPLSMLLTGPGVYFSLQGPAEGLDPLTLSTLNQLQPWPPALWLPLTPLPLVRMVANRSSLLNTDMRNTACLHIWCCSGVHL